MRRKKNTLAFIDEKKFLSKWNSYKAGNVVTYKRISDGDVSFGSIRWFEVTKSDKVVVTIVDSLLENFQSCYIEDIIDKPDPKIVKKLKRKREKISS
mgnify:CR=1 FL=1